MPAVVNSFDLTMDAEQAWAVVGDLADAASWVPGVVASRVEKDVRICTTVDGGEIRERIGQVSAADMSYHYEHLATPAPIVNSHGSLRVRQTDAGCRVEWQAEFEPADPSHAEPIVQGVTAAFREATESLKRRIEATQRP